MQAARRVGARSIAIVLAVIAAWTCGGVASAETAAGTVISNASSATFTDSSGSTNYTATSNTVTITVQNSPSITVSGGSNKTVAPGQTVTDAFTITNTGNAAGDVQISSGGVTGGTDSASTSAVTYSYNSVSYSTLSALNTALASVSVGIGSSITVYVVYTPTNTAAAGDVQTNVSATITYAAVTGASAATSSATSASSAEDDTVALDALLDVALSSSNSAGIITYTVGAVNRTTVWGAKDLLAVGGLLGLASGSEGIFISVKVPQYPSGTPLTISGTPTVTTSSTYGFASGATATIYSTANSTGASGWTSGSTPVSSAAYIGVYITGGSCTINGSTMSNVEICPVSSSGSSAGSVPNPAVTLTFSVVQSNASGATTSGSTQTIANSLIGSNATSKYVIGPGLTAGSLADSASDTSSVTATGVGINNTTSVNAPSGASSLNSTQSIAVTGPTGLGAQTDDGTVALMWTAVSGAATYKVYRGTSSGGESLYASGITLPSNHTYPIYYDKSATNGSTYYYEVTSVNGSGVESAVSSEVSATPPTLPALLYALVGAASAVGTYASDSAYMNTGSGTNYNNFNQTVDESSDINNPAPNGVYETEDSCRSCAYVLTGLRPSTSYVIRLHESEDSFGTNGNACTNNNCTGSRVFAITINGTSVLPAFDIWAAAGGTDIAIARDFTATSNSSGIIYVAFCSSYSLATPTTCTPPSNQNNAGKVDGLEVFGLAGPPSLTLVLSASTTTPSAGSAVTYTDVFTNVGYSAALNTSITIPIPSGTCFQVGSAASSMGTTGLTATVTYSNNNGTSYVYTPVSGACGSATSGYDANVNSVRFSLSGSLSATSPNNTGSVSLTTYIP